VAKVQRNRIKLSNPIKSKPDPIEIDLLINMEINHLYIPEHIAVQLDLEGSEKKKVNLVDGSILDVPYIGPIKIQFGNRSCFTGALIFGDQVVMGMIPFKDLDLVVNQSTKTLEVNPFNPNIPGSVAKDVSQNKEITC
jgi:hypothetical protein